ncbi:MAG: dynamin family protein [Xenococcaceae cyanobacterium]
MSSPIIDETVILHKSALNNLLEEIQQFSQQIDNLELAQTLASLRQNINEPFLFVVVGEVKAGKSSFINALLEENICQTAADPCTDRIQQIIYAESAFMSIISPHLVKIGLPVEILKNLSIVDTPGTNTIVENHQEITKEFIPNSDLVFFVFFAKNPYTQTAWDLLDYVNRQWDKKIIFILQQADLTKPAELSKNQEKLREYARQKGIESPIIFATSAELEFTGDKNNSGFVEVRNYIRDTLGKAESQQLKLQGIIETTQEIIKRFESDLNILQQQLEIERKSSPFTRR